MIFVFLRVVSIMSRKVYCKDNDVVKKEITVTVAGKGQIKKEIMVDEQTVLNTENILKKRKAAFEALSKF
jgi:hypothetical protein